MGTEGGTWQKSVLTLVDVQRLAGRHELAIGPKVVITPLALEEIRRLGLTLSRQELSPVVSCELGVGQDRAYAEVQSALAAMAREGVLFQPLGRPEPALQLANQCGARIARGEWQRAVLFSSEPELAACAANKLPGLRAASVVNMAQARRAFATLVPNLLVVEMPGRTFFEARQVLQLVASRPQSKVPELEKIDARG